MSIKDATPEEIQALKARINRRQADRQCEADMDEVVRMVGKRPPLAVQAARMEPALVATGTAAIAGTAAILGSSGAIPMGYAALVTGVALAGAVTEVARAI